MNRMNNGAAGCVWTTEANELRGGVSVARTIMPERLDRVPVLVLISSNAVKKVSAQTVLSNLSLGDCIEEEGEAVGMKTEERYKHLTGLMSGIDKSVTKEQEEKLKELLRKYSDVFSKNELDFGKTTLANHRIDTGDARPMRQTLRRQLFNLLEKIDKHINQFTPSISSVTLLETTNRVGMVRSPTGTFNVFFLSTFFVVPLAANSLHSAGSNSASSIIFQGSTHFSLPVSTKHTITCFPICAFIYTGCSLLH